MCLLRSNSGPRTNGGLRLAGFPCPLGYCVEAVSVFLLRWIDRQCKYVCAYLRVSVYTAICSYMYAFTHVFVIHVVFAFCCEAFKGALLGIFLPFYTQKVYSIICRSTKFLKEKKKEPKQLQRSMSPCVTTFLSVNSEPDLHRLLGRMTL